MEGGHGTPVKTNQCLIKNTANIQCWYVGDGDQQTSGCANMCGKSQMEIACEPCEMWVMKHRLPSFFDCCTNCCAPWTLVMANGTMARHLLIKTYTLQSFLLPLPVSIGTAMKTAIQKWRLWMFWACQLWEAGKGLPHLSGLLHFQWAQHCCDITMSWPMSTNRVKPFVWRLVKAIRVAVHWLFTRHLP